MTWNVKKLKDDVLVLYGENNYRRVSSSLESIIDREFYARYHYQESVRLYQKCPVDISDSSALLAVIIDNSSEHADEFYRCRKRVEANIIACLQSIHSVSDILSHVIYYSLDMDNSVNFRMRENQISIDKVKNKLADAEEYKILHNLLIELTKHADYEYLCNIVNHSKHRSIVKSDFIFYTDGGKPHEFVFRDFTYSKQYYPKRPISDYLENEYNRQNPITDKIGNEINRLVCKQKHYHSNET